MLTAIVCNFLGCELKDDPIYQERLAKGKSNCAAARFLN
jgi:anaerobic C4-dicarboxylate transporter DcuA